MAIQKRIVGILSILSIFLGLATASAHNKGRYKDREALLSFLSSGYQRDVIHDGPRGGPVVLVHGLHLQSLDSLKDNVLTLHVWEVLSWNDNRLSWDPKDYGGVNRVNIPSQSVWKPDVLLLNSAEPYNVHGLDEINVQVTLDGNVTFIPPEIQKSVCQFDESALFSNNHVTCGLGFMSWTYPKDSLDIYPLYTSIQIPKYFKKNLHWDVQNTTVSRSEIEYDNPGEKYPILQYQIDLRRT